VFVSVAINAAATVGLALLAILGHTSSARLVGLIFAVVWGVWTWRALQVGAYARNDDVKVVGFVFSRRIPWSAIESFAVMPAGRYKTVGHVVRKGHHPPIPIFAISPGGWRGKDPVGRAHRQIEQLNERLGEWRSAHPTDGEMRP
jgi:hypothetical protein